MDEKEEAAWVLGNRAAYVQLFGQCLKELGYDSPEAKESKWIKEREAAIAQLRLICEEHGDNEWDDDLHLADIIEKHLGNHLSSE